MAGVSFALSVLRFSFPRCPVSSLTRPTHIYLPVYHHALLVPTAARPTTPRPTTTRPITSLVVPLPLPEVLIAEAERYLPKTLAAGALDKAALGGIMASIVREPSPIDGHGGPHVGTFSPFFRNCFFVGFHRFIGSLVHCFHWFIAFIAFTAFIAFIWFIGSFLVSNVLM